jgi:hypothetical protein
MRWQKFASLGRNNKPHEISNSVKKFLAKNLIEMDVGILDSRLVSINITMQLHELFDKRIPWHWNSSPTSKRAEKYHYTAIAEFEIGDLLYLVEFRRTGKATDKKIKGLDNKVIIDLSFALISGAGTRNPNMKRELTGTGNQYAIFSTVIEIIDDFLRRAKNVDYLYFSAKEPSRQKLYDRLVSMYEKKSKVWNDAHDGKIYLIKV